MNNYCTKYSKFTNIKIKHEIDEQINFYYRCINCGFKRFETIKEKQLSNLLKVYTIYKTMLK